MIGGFAVWTSKQIGSQQNDLAERYRELQRVRKQVEELERAYLRP
jgi:hypothetical protein